MSARKFLKTFSAGLVFLSVGIFSNSAFAQLTDLTQTPNTMNTGIALSLTQQIGAGQGDKFTPDSSKFFIARDPARAIQRGRQLFQRKFTMAQGVGPRTATDGVGNIETDGALGAGLADSCALCHGIPRGGPGFGGDVFTRPGGRNSTHLYGIGLKEMLADEITQDLRAIRDQAIADAQSTGQPQTVNLMSKENSFFGTITANPDGTVDTSGVEGVNADLRIRPFFVEGSIISLREFVIGAFNAEMGLQGADDCLETASSGGVCTTASGLVLDGSKDAIQAPPISDSSIDGDLDGVTNEIDPAVLDYVEFFMFNSFAPGQSEVDASVEQGFALMDQVKCTKCHIRNMTINNDRRILDVNVKFNASQGMWNRLVAIVTELTHTEDDGEALPLVVPNGQPFRVRNIFTDFKRHDLGPWFHEVNFNGSLHTKFITKPLWGVGSTPPYGHDGRSTDLKEVILRHEGEALTSTQMFAALPVSDQDLILKALRSLVLYPPEYTRSTLNLGDDTTLGFPQLGQGKIDLSVLFTTPGPE